MIVVQDGERGSGGSRIRSSSRRRKVRECGFELDDGEGRGSQEVHREPLQDSQEEHRRPQGKVPINPIPLSLLIC